MDTGNCSNTAAVAVRWLPEADWRNRHGAHPQRGWSVCRGRI